MLSKIYKSKSEVLQYVFVNYGSQLKFFSNAAFYDLDSSRFVKISLYTFDSNHYPYLKVELISKTRGLIHEELFAFEDYCERLSSDRKTNGMVSHMNIRKYGPKHYEWHIVEPKDINEIAYAIFEFIKILR